MLLLAAYATDEAAIRKTDADKVAAAQTLKPEAWMAFYAYGTYQLSFTDPKAGTIAYNGKVLEIWKKQPDGAWKCIVDTWSSDNPAQPPPPAK